MTGWLRLNRWGLLGLPIAAVLAVAANTQRLYDYWWTQDLRDPAARGDTGEWVRWTDGFTDAAGDGLRTVEIRVTGMDSVAHSETAAESRLLALPPGVTATRVTMDFRAAPDQVLFGCRLALLDTDGNRYEYQPTTGDLTQDQWPCLPADQTGPQPAITSGAPREPYPGEQPRPPAWTTRPVILMPEGVEVNQVLLWWEEPDYLSIHVNSPD